MAISHPSYPTLPYLPHPTYLTLPYLALPCPLNTANLMRDEKDYFYPTLISSISNSSFFHTSIFTTLWPFSLSSSSSFSFFYPYSISVPHVSLCLTLSLSFSLSFSLPLCLLSLSRLPACLFIFLSFYPSFYLSLSPPLSYSLLLPFISYLYN